MQTVSVAARFAAIVWSFVDAPETEAFLSIPAKKFAPSMRLTSFDACLVVVARRVVAGGRVNFFFYSTAMTYDTLW